MLYTLSSNNCSIPICVYMPELLTYTVRSGRHPCQALDGEAPATREDQLRVKAGKKGKRKASENQKSRKKTKKKNAASKKGNLKPKSRRRKVLKKAKARSSSSLSPVPEDAAAEGHAKKPRHEPGMGWDGWENATGGGKARGKKATKPAAKATAKATAKAKPKAKGKAKAKASPKAVAKSKAKGPKGKPAAKAKPKAKAKARGASGGKKKAGRRMDEGLPTTMEGWQQLDTAFILTGYAAEFVEHQHAPPAEFKQVVWETLPGAGDYWAGTLNVYWSRYACGLTVKDIKKDLTSFRFVDPDVPKNLSQAVAIKAAQLMVPFSEWF